MASLQQIVAYLQQHMDRYPLAVLKGQLIKQGVPGEEIDAAIRFLLAESGGSIPTPIPGGAPLTRSWTPIPAQAPLAPQPSPGAGTALPPQASPVQPSASGGRVTSSGRAFILCVDDDPMLREMMVTRLENAGYRATSASDAAQAVVQAEGMKLSLVISDIEMPGFGSGVDALRRLRASPTVKRNLPVIFVTGMPREQAKKLMPAHDPFVRLMFKPVDWTQLQKHIRDLTGMDKGL